MVLKKVWLNISEHYNLGNDFYQWWLDSSNTFSASLFESNESDLADAKQAKYRNISETLKLDPEITVL